MSFRNILFDLNQNFFVSEKSMTEPIIFKILRGDFRGLDNKCSVVPLSFEDDILQKRRSVATHTSYMSCCTFLRSDNLVSSFFKYFLSKLVLLCYAYRPFSLILRLMFISWNRKGNEKYLQLLTGSGDSTCAIWDVESGQMIQNFLGHIGDVFAVDVPKSDTGNIFISAVNFIILVVLFSNEWKGCGNKFKLRANVLNGVNQWSSRFIRYLYWNRFFLTTDITFSRNL